jgi:MFS family permease
MAYTSPENHDRNDKMVFWGCFMALVTTSFAFISRIILCSGEKFQAFFSLDKQMVGDLIGAGLWPFAISIVLFSLIIDRIGYRIAMFFSFACYATYLTLAFYAYQTVTGASGDEATVAAAKLKGFNLLKIASVVLSLGNGTVEAFINPVVATLFSKQKTKWLNILHAGWPGGLVLGGIITIALGNIEDWRVILGIIALPAIGYLLMLSLAKFPINEREKAGVSYRTMLSELGGFGALIGFGLIALQLAKEFPAYEWYMYGLGLACVVGFVVYTQSFGRGIMAFLIIIMMPLAITEIGTDSWISGLMEEPMKAAGQNPAWVLVYTSAIMLVLRSFFAGPIVQKLTPIGLLILSASLAIAGLLALSRCGEAGLVAIFAAATLYAFGKTFFWPTMLGITSEQCPKGGALTLNAIAGIGMIAVGIIGTPIIGALQERTASAELREKNPSLAAEVVETKTSNGISYEVISPKKEEEIGTKAKGKLEGADEATKKVIEDAMAKKDSIDAAKKSGQFDALAKMALFPTFMLICYIILFIYFKSRGGYKAQDISHGGH